MTIVKLTRMQKNIIAAALRCFEKFGIQKTSMENIATEAGVARLTIYRAFGGRDNLYILILRHGNESMLEAMAAQILKQPSLKDALVDGMMENFRIIWQDKFVVKLHKKLSRRGTGDLISPEISFESSTHQIWLPIVKRSRLSGELISSLSDDRIIEGIRQFIALIMIWNLHDEEIVKKFLSDFVVPAILGVVTISSEH